MTGTIVVGVDGSTESLHALGWALSEARRREAELTAVIAWQPTTPIPSSMGALGMAETVEPVDVDHHQVNKERLDEAVAEVLRGEEHPVRTVVRQGYAGDVLTEEAKGADLLVVGSHGHGRVYSAVLGSVSADCVRKATCPVVVIPAKLDVR
ncbi:nucleotide-binding universal stress UspA family protein [Crossiella equi]|uniref:Nucleotide-binding universal stress UspA family protein n=1 Tax=Crossiella equi TaxID=130796 RepID=A0ABS5ARA2_9PSEU|nr:universal stress protein [Crossiella equi]MBP2479088.1 nucleotide-binding universal stress UspA family protein [Crossiella equi]